MDFFFKERRRLRRFDFLFWNSSTRKIFNEIEYVILDLQQ